MAERRTLGARFARLFRARIGKYDPAELPSAVGMLSHTHAGASMNEATALTLSAVYACVYKVASTLASLDLRILRQVDGTTQVLSGHPVRQLITDPDPTGTAFTFWETLTASACMYGNGFALIIRDGQGRPTRLQYVHTADVIEKRIEGAQVYDMRGLGIFEAGDVLHIRNLLGRSPIQLHRENLGLTSAAQAYGAQYFENGGQMTGVLASDQVLNSEQVAQMQKSWNASSTTAGVKLLPFGFKYTPITLSPADMTFLETRAFQAEEICRIFNVPRSLIQLGEETVNNVEQQHIQFRTNLVPWMERIEQEVTRKLIGAPERPQTLAKFDTTNFFRADMATRSEFYREALAAGWMSINEVRSREGLNPTPGGDVHTVQVNALALDRLGDYSDKLASNGVE